MADQRLRALDGIRAVAVMAVVLAHIGWRVGRGGYLGVDIFFVLSGYLITRLLLDEQRRSGSISLGRFYVRRALRLYPALVVCVIGCGLAGSRLYESVTDWARAAAYSLSYVMDVARAAGWTPESEIGPLGVTWSLSVEEHFYLVWPVGLMLLLALRRKREYTVFLTAAIVACVSWGALLALSRSGISRGLIFHPELRSAALFVGCAAACLPAPKSTRLLRPLMYAGALVIIVLLQRSGSNTAFATFALSMPLTWLATALLIVGLTTIDSVALAAVLGWGPIAYVGRISYGIYLYHLPIITMIDQHHLRFAVRMPLSVLIPVAVAAASFHLVERPFLRLKDRVAGRPQGAAQLQPSPT